MKYLSVNYEHWNLCTIFARIKYLTRLKIRNIYASNLVIPKYLKWSTIEKYLKWSTIEDSISTKIKTATPNHYVQNLMTCLCKEVMVN